MSKYIYNILVLLCLSACVANNPQENNATVGYMDSVSAAKNDTDSIKSAVDIVPSSLSKLYKEKDRILICGDTFFIFDEIDESADTQEPNVTLSLYKKELGKSLLIDSLNIDASSALSYSPNVKWLDTVFILNDTTKAFGHLVSGCNSCYENHLCDTNFELIAVSPHSIRLVMSESMDFDACDNYSSEQEECSGKKRTFKTTDSRTNGYYDIIVSEEKWSSKGLSSDDEDYKYSRRDTTYLIKYMKGMYKIVDD